ncbi:MAG: Maf family protein [Pirellulaceae bacterium]
MQLILASGSPRRRQLLAEAGYQFNVAPPDEGAETVPGEQLSARELVAALAFQKAANVAARTESGLVLAADTLAECRGEILGKPHDRADARRILEQLSGQVHFVHTGVCLWRRPDDHKSTQTVTTELEMARMTDRQIEEYLDSGQWQGKAGAFGYQDGIDWVTIRKGSASNVVGLPMDELAQMLADAGFRKS